MHKLRIRRLLDPGERVAEGLFGLIMVLTFTGSLSVATAQTDRSTVHTMLVGALGCNLAWGIIDGIFYLMGCLATERENLRAWRALKKAPNPEAAHGILAGLLPPPMAELLTPAEYEAMRVKLEKLPHPPVRPWLKKQDWIGAVAVFLWVFAVTFPVVIPFVFMHDVARAMRVSNGIAVGLLFAAGYAYGRFTEYNPWLTGLVVVALGGVMVALTIALGG